MIKKVFIKLVSSNTSDQRLIAERWQEIEKQYSGPDRHYHTLRHLDNLLVQLISVKSHIGHFDTVLFSMFYHDIIYNPLKTDNEERSADLAEKRLSQFGLQADVINACREQIIATKTHTLHASQDVNYFTDADLTILGHPWATYCGYLAQIRREYSAYPDSVYKPGRMNVVQHFLQMERIFKTHHFHDKFEQQARENLQRERSMISG